MVCRARHCPYPKNGDGHNCALKGSLEECLHSRVEDAAKKAKRAERDEAICREEGEREELRRAQYQPPSYSNPADWLGMGLQILAESPVGINGEFKFKFPYLLSLAKCDISLSDWNRFVAEILRKFDPCGGGRFHHPRICNFKIHTIAKNIETVLDNVAEQDKAFFRPRGLIMRMDMPGEQKFGLDFMDLYCGKVDSFDHEVHNLDNDSWRCSGCRYLKHSRNIRQKFFEGTRIVISPLTILEDPDEAYKHGWTNWIKQCEDANANKPKGPEQPAPILDLNALAQSSGEEISRAEAEHFAALDAYFEPLMKRPLCERIFRWPPSKQIYYDRWRGHTDIFHEKRIQVHLKGHTRKRYLPQWIPWEDSMDKRMETQWTQRCVVAADDFKATMMELACIPEDECARKNPKPKFASHLDREKQKTTREEKWRLRPLISEKDTALDELHWTTCPKAETAHQSYKRRRREYIKKKFLSSGPYQPQDTHNSWGNWSIWHRPALP